VVWQISYDVDNFKNEKNIVSDFLAKLTTVGGGARQITHGCLK